MLGVAQVGLTADFFELGGHSLAATRVIHRVREQLNVELPLRALFETPDLRSFAAQVADSTPTARRRLPFDPATLDSEAARLWLGRLDQLPDEAVERLLARLNKEEAT